MKRLFLLVTLCLTQHISADRCDRELFTAFYPAPFVAETLDTFDVPEQDRTAIIAELNNRELDVVTMVEHNAEQLNPNPLLSGNQTEIVKLFDQAVIEIFTEVMHLNGITDDDDIHTMMEDIHQQKAARFRQCMNLTP